jgi:hypothetical protein
MTRIEQSADWNLVVWHLEYSRIYFELLSVYEFEHV